MQVGNELTSARPIGHYSPGDESVQSERNSQEVDLFNMGSFEAAAKKKKEYPPPEIGIYSPLFTAFSKKKQNTAHWFQQEAKTQNFSRTFSHVLVMDGL